MAMNWLFRAAAVLNSNDNDAKIDLHKTAIQRQGLSTPMKTLAKHNYLNGDYTVFDYGCGLDDDLKELEAQVLMQQAGILLIDLK